MRPKDDRKIMLAIKRNVGISFADDDEELPKRGAFYIVADYTAFAEDPQTEELEELGDGTIEGSYSAAVALSKMGDSINRKYPGTDYAELDIQELIPEGKDLTVHFKIFLTTKDKPAPKNDPGLVKVGEQMLKRMTSYFDEIKKVKKVRKVGEQDYLLEFDAVFSGFVKDAMSRLEHIVTQRFTSAWTDEVKYEIVK